VQPLYPNLAQQKRVQGTVVLQATVSKEGKVGPVRALNRAPSLTPVATEAVKQWLYKPYFGNGQPVAFRTQVTLQLHP
jgi:periplasmic protein TonB